MAKTKVLVLAATGTMGSGLIKALKDDPDHELYAFTRNTDSKAATALKADGIKVLQGDFSDPESLSKALSIGFDAVFFIIFPDLMGGDNDLVEARNIITAVQDAKVKQLIYGSVARIGTQENFDKVYAEMDESSFLKGYFIKKFKLDQLVRDSGVESWTIIKPPTFIQNIVWDQSVAMFYPDLAASGTFYTAVDHNLKQWWVDGSDVGKFAAAAIRDPAKFHQKEITFGTEGLNAHEIVAKLSKARGKEVKLGVWTDEEWEVKKANPFYSIGPLQNAMGFDPSIGEEEKYGVELTSIDEWLEKNKEGTWLAS